MRVEFKRGREKDLPKEGNLGTLFFTWDTGRIFEGNGKGKKLTDYSSVLSGYDNLAMLEALNPRIGGKIYVTNDGGIYIYNGINYIEVGGSGNGNAPTDMYEVSWENQTNNTLIKIIDIKELFIEKNMRSIDKSELIIYNNSIDSDLKDNSIQLVVKDKDIPIMDVKIKPQDTQKYLLGISTNTKVFVKGYFSGRLYINYYKK
ncbi:MAG: hypothetical protein ACLUCH_06130 [Lachnospirales bacterium]